LADNQNKHSLSRAQGSRRNAHAPTGTHAPTKPHRLKSRAKTRQSKTPAPTKSHTRGSTKPRAKSRGKAKRTRLPPSLRYTESKRGKTTIRRYPGRTFYRFEEVKGKLVDLVEIFTAGGAHSIDLRFADKTAIHITIDPGFTLEAEYADWKTGDWRPIKRWPLIRSAGHDN
jgi:hypothetical protein